MLAIEYVKQTLGREGQERVQKKLDEFGPLMTEEGAALLIAKEHGWSPEPEAICTSGLDAMVLDVVLEDKADQWGSAPFWFEAEVVEVEKPRALKRRGKEATGCIVHVRDLNVERRVAVFDLPGFESKGGKQIKPNMLCTLFQVLDLPEGTRLKFENFSLRKYQPQQDPYAEGGDEPEVRYFIESDQFSKIKTLTTPAEGGQ